jgi:hypothetical protein
MNCVGTTSRISMVRMLTLSLALTILILTAPLQSQTLRGTVKDGATGGPIADASVVMMDDEGRIQRGTLTEPDGSFVLVAPDDGSYTLRVGAAGFAVQDTPPLRVPEGEEARVDILLLPEEQESGAPAGFTQRMARGEGTFLTPEDIERRTGDLFTDIFSFTPEVKVVPLPASTNMNAATSVHGNPTRFSRRTEAVLGGSGSYLTLRIKAGRDFSQVVVGAVQQGEPAHDCVPVIWVDGIWWGGIDEASDYGPDGAITPSDVEAIEIYNHPSILPNQFDTGRETLCGVIVVWRKKTKER